jgi:CRP-like cAMP-binding protein
MIFANAGPGDIVAEGSAYSEIYHCDAIVSAGGEAAVIGRPSFRDRLRGDPDLADRWAQHLAIALRDARARTELRSLRRVADRLDAWLAAGNELPPHGQLQDVAAEISVTREALYRTLSGRRS